MVAWVLVVEDEQSWSGPLRYMLRDEGFEVAVAATGLQALAEFDRNGADLVLLDLMLPGMSGVEVCRHLRARGGGTTPTPASSILTVGPVRLDLDAHTATINGTEMSLTSKEFLLLEMLLRNAGQVLTRAQLIDRAWPRQHVADTRILDMHIQRLRSKIEADPSTPHHLQTVRGIGYKFLS